MTKWQSWSQTRKVRALTIMDDYVKKHADLTAYDYWRNEIKSLFPTSTDRAEILNSIASDDALFADALFVFYIAITTDTSWLKVQLSVNCFWHKS